MTLEIQCDDFLRDNHHVYAAKAARKKIAIIRITAKNGDSADVKLLLGTSKLTAGGQTCNVEDPAVIIRKLGEFTWDFLLYSIIDFHPVTAVIDATLFLTGPFYNRRLKRQLALLSNGEMTLAAGESKTALVAFRGVPKNLERVVLTVSTCDGEQQYTCEVRAAVA